MQDEIEKQKKKYLFMLLTIRDSTNDFIAETKTVVKKMQLVIAFTVNPKNRLAVTTSEKSKSARFGPRRELLKGISKHLFIFVQLSHFK